MKKILFAITFLCCYLFAVAHQPGSTHIVPLPKSNENRSVFFGLSFGPTADWFSPINNKPTSRIAKGGFITGLNVDVRLTKNKIVFFTTGLHFKYLQGELQFNEKYTFKFISDSAFIIPTTRSYQTMYLTIPTGIKFRTPPMDGCVFLGKLGFAHHFKISGNQYDRFLLPEPSTNYNVITDKIKNKDAALFAESGFVGIGFEYVFKNSTRAFINVDYNCQFNYFSANARNSITDTRFKAVIHSLQIVLGFMF
jgi:hypothetical protein